MKHLKELGIDTSGASMHYWVITNGEYSENVGGYVFSKEPSCITLKLYPYKFMSDALVRRVKDIPTFTLQDILDFLPYKIVTSYLNIGKKSFSGDILFYIEYSNFGGYAISCFRNDNLIDAAYEMLCWCIENGYVGTCCS